MENLNILYLEDSIFDAELVTRELKKSGLLCTILRVDTRDEYIRALDSEQDFDLILSDHSMFQFNSFEALRIFKDRMITIPFILVTGSVSEEFAVDILKEGADDYILKENLTRLPSAIKNALGKKFAEREREEAERKLREVNDSLAVQASRLKSINAELEQFAYVVSHDLQEPLRMISGFMTLLEKNYASRLDDKAHQYIHFAVDGANRMRKLIESLLEYARIDKTDYKLEVVEIREVIDDIKLLYSKLVIDKKAVIVYDKMPAIKTYRPLIHQIFQNLISNALKFTRENSQVRITITYKELDEHHQFMVSDNGIGIEADNIDRLFVMFHKSGDVHNATTKGMGLAITHKIIETLEGMIHVETEPGKGSSFIFTLPKVSKRS